MRARRSCLVVPGRPAEKLAKGPALVADEVIVDLEDAVPPGLKDEAREAVAAALSAHEWAAETVSVRVNALTTPWFEADVAAIAASGSRVASLVLPKAERAADVQALAAAVTEAESRAGRDEPVALQALIETAAGLQRVAEIATASPRLEALILGPADLSVSLGFPSPDEGSQWDYVRGAILVAARVAGVQAIDGPFLRFRDLDGLRDSASRARRFGFDGKWALHPAQVETLDRVFSPTEDEVEVAEAILATLQTPNAAGAFDLEGEMIDEASRRRAEQVLERARVQRRDA